MLFSCQSQSTSPYPPRLDLQAARPHPSAGRPTRPVDARLSRPATGLPDPSRLPGPLSKCLSQGREWQPTRIALLAKELWLQRVIGKYMQGLQEIAQTGTDVVIKTHGPLVRKEVDDEMVRHSACLFHHWIDPFKVCLQASGVHS